MMKELENRGELNKDGLRRGKRLKIAAWTSPLVLTFVPAICFFTILMLFGSTPPVAATIFFLGLIVTLIGLIVGLSLTGFFSYRYSEWKKNLREQIAARGIRAEEVHLFTNEMTGAEKKTLAELQKKDLLLADAFRETLASRLTATRIYKQARAELQIANRRQNKLKYAKTEKKDEFKAEIERDIKKLKGIKNDAEQMRGEAEMRLQMIDAAARRGTTLADSEIALKKLSARSAELPIALESARLEDEIRREVDEGMKDESKDKN